jgi:hypothetical protein
MENGEVSIACGKLRRILKTWRVNMKLIAAKSLFVIFVVTQCIACAGGAKKTAQAAESEAASSAQSDMTRPPVTIGAQQKIVVESNPDETISFDEWKKRQTEAEAPAQSPATDD